MIWYKHIYKDNKEDPYPVAQSTSELATHAISRLLGEETADAGFGVALFDFSLPRPQERARILQYLENSAVESGQPPNPETVEWLMQK